MKNFLVFLTILGFLASGVVSIMFFMSDTPIIGLLYAFISLGCVSTTILLREDSR